MKRILGQSVSLVALVALGSIFTPACADEDGSVFVVDNLAPPSSRQAGTCTYTPDVTQSFLSQGTLDLGLVGSYGVSLLIANQMIQRGDIAAPRSESNRFHIEGAVVRVTDANGAEVNSFTSVSSGFADASNGTTPGFGIAFLTAIDGATTERIRPAVLAANNRSKLYLANMKVFGKTIGGIDVETAEWSYPINVCYGCLVDFRLGDDKASAGVDCSNTTVIADPLVTQQAPCKFGQDEAVPCQLCKASLPACNGQ